MARVENMARSASRNTTRNLRFDQEIGARILRFRKASNITQEALASKLRVSFQQIQKYEKGTNSVPSTRIPDLCKALSIKPNDLFGL
jgi:transcriptional regulator with XRE-family HTH domain